MSGLTSQIRSGGVEVARAGPIATLFPAAKPPFLEATTSETQPPHPSSRMALDKRSAESSPEAFSTTTTRAVG